MGNIFEDSNNENNFCESQEDEINDKKSRKNVCPTFNPNTKAEDIKFEVGLKFADKNQLNKALRNYKILNGYSIKTIKSDKGRLQAKCSGNGCDWILWASKCSNEQSFQVTTISQDHSCLSFSFECEKRLITSDWLAERYLEKLRIQPEMKLRILKATVDQDLISNVSVKMCYLAKKKAIEKIVGNYKLQFGLLRDYGTEVLNKNPGSTVVVSTNNNVFDGIYICLWQLKQGFLNGCRPVLSIDGCFIKGPWKGQILVAVGRDGNNQMYPIAWAICEKENGISWGWFISMLANDLEIGDGFGYTIISDQQKGLVDSVAKILPRAEHRLCARHVYANLRKKFKGLKYRQYFWAIAKSTTKADYERNMKVMKDFDQGAWDFLMKKKPEHWCRYFFSCTPKCDSVDNNMAEIFNGSILEARYKPIISMLDDIFSSTMTRIGKKHDVCESNGGKICTRIQNKLKQLTEGSRWWKTVIAGNGNYSVRHGVDGFVVSLVHNTCSCGAWELSGIPCVHAIAVITFVKQKKEDYVDEFYSVDKYQKAFAYAINPINGQNMWAINSSESILPPPFVDSKKNLTFKRRLEEGERKNKKVAAFGKMSRKGQQKTCSKCHEVGHTKTTCKNRDTQCTFMVPTPQVD